MLYENDNNYIEVKDLKKTKQNKTKQIETKN